MFVAEKLRKENIAEYLLYMWQVEDLVRAFGLDEDAINRGFIGQFGELSDEQRTQMKQWYADIVSMMRGEKITERGHLQICKNVLINLTDLHQRLMGSTKFPYYHAAYHKALPLIVELRTKQGGAGERSELETCFELLYGVMLLKMQHRDISTDTARAVETISTFLGMLSDYYKKDKEESLEI